MNQMLYRKAGKNGDELSILGYGCMRFPRKNGMLDESRIESQVVSAIEQGVNYFDTAYLYPGSEKALGKVLAKGYRDQIKLATKLPIHRIQKREEMDSIFNEQLTNLQTDRIDYYLMHNINTFADWERLKSIHVEAFIEQEKKKGRIINIGFSFHGNIKDFKNITDDYPWDFCQIQYNYIDENHQAGKEGLEYAAQKGLAVIVMEPLRGGMLVEKMPEEAQKIIKDFKIKRKPAEWALRWVWNHPEVTVLLSGMNAEAHIAENIRTASEAHPNSMISEEIEMINAVKAVFKSKIKVNCTGCAYCMPCPFGVNIPQCFTLYNSKSILGGVMPLWQYLSGTSERQKNARASACRQCGACEKLCPQNIEIRKELKKVSKEMEKPYYKAAVRISDIFMYGRKKRARD